MVSIEMQTYLGGPCLISGVNQKADKSGWDWPRSGVNQNAH